MYKDRGIMKWAPFDALTGFNELIKDLKHKLGKKEKPELLEDRLEELDRTLKKAIKEHQTLMVEYFHDGYIITTHGHIAKVDFHHKLVQLDTKEVIRIDDIINLEMFS